MTTKSELEHNIRNWHAEFTALGIEADRLPAFLASRLIESGVVHATDAQNIVTAMIGGRSRRVRITGRQPNTSRLFYECADGQMGMGILQVTDVAKSEHAKLADILDRMEGIQ